MTLLADWVLKVDGESFGASQLEERDVTRPDLDANVPCRMPRVSFGVSASDLPRLRQLTGQVARLFEPDGRARAHLRIEKVDPELRVVVATLLPGEAMHAPTTTTKDQASVKSESPAGALPPARGMPPELGVARSGREP